MTAATAIHIWEPSNHPRHKWPITVSVPFASGAVREPRQVILRDPRAGQVRVQRRVLATWPDGSIKWLLLDFPLDLAPREQVDVAVEIARDPVGVDAQDGLRIEWAGDELHIDTGPMQCRLASDRGGLLRQLTAHGVPYTNRVGTVRIGQPNGELLDMLNAPAAVNIEENGSQRTVISVRGKHHDPTGRAALDYLLRIVVYAHQPILRWYHTLINKEPDDPVPISSVQMIQPLDLHQKATWAIVGTDRTPYSMPEGWVSMTTDGLETRVNDGNRRSRNLNTIRAEVPMEPFLVVGDDERMVTMLPRWCHLLYPKAAHYYGKALRYDIWPETAKTWEFRRGMAKTHELVLGFAPPVQDYDGAMPFVAPILRPVIATLPPEYIESTRALPVFFAARPERYPKLETTYAKTFYGLARAYGMLHYGDANGVAYTAQGRGRTSDGGRATEAIIWVNNEYDMPYMAMQQFLRTGDRNVWLHTAEPHVWHMMDVDTVHYAPEHPTYVGGQVLHLANHVGPPGYHVDPSHEWVEGLILYHLLTGLEHPREHALALGEHLLAWTEAHRADLNSDWMASRVTGWALIALAALYEFTLDTRYLQCAIEHGTGLHERVTGTTGHLTESVSYGFPYRAGFMTDLAVIGLKRLHDISGDDRWRDLALGLVDDQLEHLSLPTGLLVYKELPENHFPMTAMFDLEVMAYAWQWTGDLKYLAHGVRLLRLYGPAVREEEAKASFLVEAPEGALYQEVRFFHRDSHFMLNYRFELPFLKVMHDLGLLAQFEPPDIDLSRLKPGSRKRAGG